MNQPATSSDFPLVVRVRKMASRSALWRGCCHLLPRYGGLPQTYVSSLDAGHARSQSIFNALPQTMAVSAQLASGCASH